MWEQIAAKIGWAIFWGRLKSVFGGKKVKITKREVEVPVPGGRSIIYSEKITEVPLSKETMIFIDGGIESIFTSPATAKPMSEALSKAGAKELEEPKVRMEQIKQRGDAEKLVEAPQVKALPDEEKLRFGVFAFIAYGDEKFHSDDFSEAEKAYLKAYGFAQQLDDKTLQSICLNVTGAAVGKQGKHEAALSMLEKSVELIPDFAGAWYNRGVVLGELGRDDEAIICFDEALRLEPNEAVYYYGKGLTLAELGQHKEALIYYDEAINLKHDFAEAWNNKGAILCDELLRREEAISFFDKALEYEPGLVNAWFSKGVALWFLERYEEALVCYDEVIELKPDSIAEAWWAKGRVLNELGRRNDALSCFDEAIRSKPDSAKVWNDIGVALGELGRHSEANTCFDQAIRLEPAAARGWWNKGIGLGHLGRHHEAITCYDEAIGLEPNAAVYYRKGLSLKMLGQCKEELVCYDEAINLKHDFAEAWNNKGAILCDELGQIEGAIICFDKAVEFAPNLIEAWCGKGVALSKLGLVKEAKRNFEKALSMKDKMPDKGIMAFDYFILFILKHGLESVESGDLSEVKVSVTDFVQLWKEAQKLDIAQRVNDAISEFKKGLSKKDLRQFRKFEIMLEEAKSRD